MWGGFFVVFFFFPPVFTAGTWSPSMLFYCICQKMSDVLWNCSHQSSEMCFQTIWNLPSAHFWWSVWTALQNIPNLYYLRKIPTGRGKTLRIIVEHVSLCSSHRKKRLLIVLVTWRVAQLVTVSSHLHRLQYHRDGAWSGLPGHHTSGRSWCWVTSLRCGTLDWHLCPRTQTALLHSPAQGNAGWRWERRLKGCWFMQTESYITFILNLYRVLINRPQNCSAWNSQPG